MILQQRIENYWTTRANSFSQSIKEDLLSFKRDAWKKLISENSGQSENVCALDIGTGPGFFSVIMSDLGYKVTAVDCSENMLLEARRNVENAGFSVQFVKADVHKLPFSDNTFDLLVCRNLVWTLENPAEAYKESYRVLKNNGRLLVFDANWYLRLQDTTLQEKYEQNKKLMENLGYESPLSREQKIEIEKIARKLPLTYELRPEWDKKTLLECGFSKIMIDIDLSNRICNDLDKLRYSDTPVFLVCAYKSDS